MTHRLMFAAALAVLFVGGISTGAGGSPTSIRKVCSTVTRTVTSTVTTVSTVISTVMQTVTVTSSTTTATVTTTPATTTAPTGSTVGSTDSATTANIWIDTNGGTCSRSGSQVAYSDFAACSSIPAAYQACRDGDIVRIRPGTYGGNMSITSNNANLTTTCQMYGQGAPVFTGRLENVHGSHLKLNALKIDEMLFDNNTDQAVNDVGADQITIRRLQVYGNTNDSSFTNSIFDGQNNYEQNQIAAYYPSCCATSPAGLTLIPRNITFVGDTFRNYTCPGGCGQVHTECIQIRSWTGTTTIDRSLFYNCDATAYLSIGNDHGTGTANITSNTFGCGGTTFYAVHMGTDAGSTFNYKFNSSACKGVGTETPTFDGAVWNIVGNLNPFTSTLCHGNTSYNLSTGGNCGGPGDATVSSLGFVNGSGNDFHLVNRAEAIDQGGPSCPSPDYYGAVRPRGSACDAGASES